MSSVGVDLAEAVTAWLNDVDNAPDGGWVQSFEAERTAAQLSLAELESLNNLRVLVFSGPVRAERVGRKGQPFKKTYKTTVAVHRRLDHGTYAANLELADQLVELTEQIETQLEDADFDDLSFVAFNEEQYNDAYSADVMQTANLFVHAVTLEHTTG